MLNVKISMIYPKLMPIVGGHERKDKKLSASVVYKAISALDV